MTNPTLVEEAVERIERALEAGHANIIFVQVGTSIHINPADLRTLLASLPTDDNDTVIAIAKNIEDDRSRRHYGIPGDWERLPEYLRGERIHAARAAIHTLIGRDR